MFTHFRLSAVTTTALLFLFTALSLLPLHAAWTNKKLNGPLIAFGDVLHENDNPDANAPFVLRSNDFTPDGQTVVYIADADTDDLFELYAVPTTGGSVHKISGGGDVHGDVHEILLSSDSKYVAFRAYSGVDGFDLFSTRISTGIPVQLDIASAAGYVGSIAVNQASDRVIFTVSDSPAGEGTELYSAPITGGIPVKLNGALVAGGEVEFFRTAGNYVVYSADQDTDEVTELYRVPIEGGTSVKLNEPLVTGGEVRGSSITPDGNHVLYVADQETAGIPILYTMPIAGGPARKLSAGILPGNNTIWRLLTTLDSQWVVFRSSDLDNDSKDILYSARIADGELHQLSEVMTSGSYISEVYLSADGQYVTYHLSTPARSHLIAAPIAGGELIELTALLPDDVSIRHHLLPLDGQQVVYITQTFAEPETLYSMYSVPITGGTPISLYTQPVWLAFGSLQFSPDSSQLFFRTSGLTNDLYSVPVAGGDLLKLNGELVEGGRVYDFRASPVDDAVIYRADQETDDQFELFVTDGFERTPTATATHTATATSTSSPTVTASPTATATIVDTATPTASATQSLIVATPTSTATGTPEPPAGVFLPNIRR